MADRTGTPTEGPASVLCARRLSTRAEEDSDRWHIYAKRFDGSSWVEAGAGSSSGQGVARQIGAIVSPPAIAVDGAGAPIAAWTGAGGTYVKRFDGGAWVQVPGDSLGPGGSSERDSASGGDVSNGGPDYIPEDEWNSPAIAARDQRVCIS